MPLRARHAPSHGLRSRRAVRLCFVVPGHVVPSQRVRKIPFHRRNGKLGVAGVTPPESDAYMDHVAKFARMAVAAMPEWSVVIAKKLPVRVSFHVLRHHWRGDIDNVQKNLFDGMARAKVVFRNDNRIVELLGSIVTDKKCTERAELMIEVVYAPTTMQVWQKMALDRGWRPPDKTQERTNK